jgi:uncharacterized pyridoxal phosphate-containing UPF0001 family protein
MLIDPYHLIKNQLPNAVQLVIVLKTNPVEKIKVIYDLGQCYLAKIKCKN